MRFLPSLSKPLSQGLHILSIISLVSSTTLLGVLIAPVATTHAAPVAIFSDDFESGSLATNGWSINSPGGTPTSPQVLAEAQSTLSAGSFGVRLDGDGDDTITKTFSTKEFFNVRLSYDRKTNGLEGDDHFLSRFDVNADGGFKTIEDIQNDADWATTAPSLSLTGAAANNLAVGIRYRVLGDSAEEFAYLDNVTVTGDPIVRNDPQITCGEPTDIMLVLDRSASMDDLGGTPPRPIQDAKDAAKNFVDIVSGGAPTLANHRIGVVSFSDSATLNIPLSTDVAAIKTSIDGLTAGGRTNMQAGIEMGFANLGGGANTTIILLSDGRANEPDPEEEAPNAAIARGNEAKTAGVRFSTIGLNMINDHPAENTLKAIASIDTEQETLYSGGTQDDLEGIFSDIAFQLCPPPQPPTVSKTVSKDTANPGDVLTYTITLEHANADPLENVIVTDQVPAQCSAVGAIDTGGVKNGTAITWTFPTLPAGATAVHFDCTLTASFVEGTTAVTNMAEVCWQSTEQRLCADDDALTNVTVQPQGTPGETPTAPPQVPNGGVPIQPTITLDKTDVKDPVKPGENITYVLSYAVANASVANLVLTDQLPTGVTFVSATHSGTYDAATRVVTWQLGTVAPGNYVANVTAKADALTTSTTVTNGAVLRATDVTDATADEKTTIIGEPILSIAKIADTRTAKPGEVVEYRVTIQNAGTNDATGVVLTDTLPKGFTLVETGAPTLTREIGTIRVGETYATTYRVQIAADEPLGTYENVAVATAANHRQISAQAPVEVAFPVTVLGVTATGEEMEFETPVEVLGAETLAESGVGTTDLLIASAASLLIALGVVGLTGQRRLLRQSRS